jgi:DNA polymerase-3 subunit delta'
VTGVGVTPFSAILGQERAMGLLRRYAASERKAAGFLFHGEEGIGKEMAAHAFAEALICREPGADGACGRCRDCLLLAKDGHPSLFVITKPEGKASIPIDSIRALWEELSLKAFSDRPRVILFLPADDLQLPAANALLKTLEEPPPSTHLLLVAHRLSRVPATILSRCQKIPFSPLPPEVVEQVLLASEAMAGRGADEALRTAVACSGGSPGRALAMLEAGDETRREWLRLFCRFDAAATFKFTDAWKKVEERDDAFAVPLSLLRDLLLLSSGSNGAIMNEDMRNELGSAANRKSPGGWARAMKMLLETSRMPPKQFQRRLAVEALIFRSHGKE